MIKNYRKYLDTLYPTISFVINVSANESGDIEFVYWTANKEIGGSVYRIEYRQWERDNIINGILNEE